MTQIQTTDLTAEQQSFIAEMQKIQHAGILKNDQLIREKEIADDEERVDQARQDAQKFVKALGSNESIVERCITKADKGKNYWKFRQIEWRTDKHQAVTNDFIKQFLNERGFVCKEVNEQMYDEVGGYTVYYLAIVWNT